MTNIEKIRQEIERLKKCSKSSKKEWIDEGYNQNAFAEDCRIKSFDKLLAFIDSLPEEKPSLPDNLDEAAEEYAWQKEEPLAEGERLSTCFNPRIEAFKAGGKWMAEQGYTTETIIDRTPMNGPIGICLHLHDSTGFKIDDKVIVQIRKK